MIWKMLAAVIALVLMGFVPAAADEPNWARTDLNNAEYLDRVYIDIGSFVVQEKVLRFVKKTVSPNGSYTIQKVSLDCARRKFKVLSYHLYDRDGMLLDEDPEPTPWLDIGYAGPFAHTETLLCEDGVPKPFDELSAVGALIYNLRQLRGYRELR